MVSFFSLLWRHVVLYELHSGVLGGVWADVIVAWKKLYTLSSLLKAVSIVSKDVNLENALLALDTITGSPRIWTF